MKSFTLQIDDLETPKARKQVAIHQLLAQKCGKMTLVTDEYVPPEAMHVIPCHLTGARQDAWAAAQWMTCTAKQGVRLMKQGSYLSLAPGR